MTNKPRVLLLNKTCLEVIDSHHRWLADLDVEVIAGASYGNLSQDEFEIELQSADGIIGPSVPSISSDLMRRLPRLRVISLASSGYDSIDVPAATAEGIVVTHAVTQGLSEVVADFAWGLMLAVARQIPLHDRLIRSGDHHRGMGTSPWRKTLGIIGLGQIGKAVARRAAGFEMTVLATDPKPDTGFIAEHNVRLVELDELLRLSDFVSIHVRLTDATKGMLDLTRLNQMKPTAFVINTARRELIDEQALVQALQHQRLAGAGLDDPPKGSHSVLLELNNVVFTTHLGNRARVGVDAVFRRAVENAADVLAGRPCSFVVNSVGLSNKRSRALS